MLHLAAAMFRIVPERTLNCPNDFKRPGCSGNYAIGPERPLSGRNPGTVIAAYPCPTSRAGRKPQSDEPNWLRSAWIGFLVQTDQRTRVSACIAALPASLLL
jgi:hypothetical protein